ncbi:MAG: tyrosine-type recombinase/integrase [Candidatus Bathyarchaeota archaeon]|nr:tyrosine-type recombinase/integrase [Candidatus Bathyarchaeum tardum]
MPNYTKKGKIELITSDTEFFNKVSNQQTQLGNEKTSFVCALYYFGIRVSEALNLTKESFTIKNKKLYVDVGQRLKHSKRTPPLSVKLDRPFVHNIVSVIQETDKGSKVWNFSRVTAWRIINKHFDKYPHYYRLNRITTFFDKGYPISKVKSWTGLTLKALDYYVGVSDVSKMGNDV